MDRQKLEQLITEKNITVEGLEELEALIVPADQSMLDQVIYNLVDNAVKFTDNNGKIKDSKIRRPDA